MFPNEKEAFEILAGRKAVDPLRGRLAEIPKEDFMSVGVEAEWQVATIPRLDVLTLLFSLLASDLRIRRGFLGFHHSNRFAVLAEKNVVAKLARVAARLWTDRQKLAKAMPVIIPPE